MFEKHLSVEELILSDKPATIENVLANSIAR